MAGSDLAQLFHCERHVRTFGPNGMPLRACLRRQLERKRVGEGAKAKLQVVHEFCGEGACELGRTHLEAAGDAARTCPGCGAALLEVEACEVCHPPRALASKPPPSARIWEKGAVPDVAIGPPPATSEFTGYRPNVGHAFTTDAEGTARAMRRKREQAAELLEEDLEADDDLEAQQDQPPAREAPAEESTMAKDEQRTCSIDGCGKALRASNTKGICGPCQAKGHGRYTVGARKTTTTPKAATPKPASAPAPKLLRWKEAPGNVAPVGTWDDLVRLEDEELLELRSRVDVELTRRLEASEARVDRLRSAVAAANAERRVSA